MIIRSPKELAAAVRERRKVVGMDQATLASRAGVSRQWISALENGKSTLEFGLVLQTLKALDMPLSTSSDVPPPTGISTRHTDLKSIIDGARRR